MTLLAPHQELAQAVEIIHKFAEAVDTNGVVITADLDLIWRWGALRKAFCSCCKQWYLHQLDPQKSVEEFRRHLVTVLNTKTVDDNPNFRATCARACAAFNRLIVVTNEETPSPVSRPEGLILHFDELTHQRCHVGRIEGNGDGASIITGPGEGFSPRTYAQLLTSKDY